jgi:hypothetical protein
MRIQLFQSWAVIEVTQGRRSQRGTRVVSALLWAEAVRSILRFDPPPPPTGCERSFGKLRMTKKEGALSVPRSPCFDGLSAGGFCDRLGCERQGEAVFAAEGGQDPDEDGDGEV